MIGADTFSGVPSFTGGASGPALSEADGFAQAGGFGDFYFGGSGAGIQHPGSSWQAVMTVAVIVLGFLMLWKTR